MEILLKIVFLDIDGVLNCKTDFNKRVSCGKCLGMDKVDRLRTLLKLTGAKVVLSSTWRRYEDHCKYLRRHGVNFIDSTPLSVKESWGGNYVRRGMEIDVWLKQHPEVHRYVILDDDSDMLKHQAKFFVQTSWETGLQDDHIEVAAKILNEA